MLDHSVQTLAFVLCRSKLKATFASRSAPRISQQAAEGLLLCWILVDSSSLYLQSKRCVAVQLWFAVHSYWLHWSHADFTWTTIGLMVWLTMGNQVGVIAACIPTFKPLYVNAAGSLYAVWSKSRSSKGYYAQSDDQHHLKMIRPQSDPYTTTIAGLIGYCNQSNDPAVGKGTRSESHSREIQGYYHDEQNR